MISSAPETQVNESFLLFCLFFINVFVFVYISVYLVDVVVYFSTGLVANAASYLQHLAYGDDSMKAKIRFKMFLIF